MKRFDKQKAKDGAPVVLQIGESEYYPVRIVSMEDNVVLVQRLFQNNVYEGLVRSFDIDTGVSKFNDAWKLGHHGTKREGWINLYSVHDDNVSTAGVFETREEALNHKLVGSFLGYVDTVRIEWEE